jgi:hypothetical protein
MKKINWSLIKITKTIHILKLKEKVTNKLINKIKYFLLKLIQSNA